MTSVSRANFIMGAKRDKNDLVFYGTKTHNDSLNRTMFVQQMKINVRALTVTQY